MIDTKRRLANQEVLIIKEAEVHEAEKIINYLNVIGGESDYLLFGAGEFRLSVEQEKQVIANHFSSENNVMLVAYIGEVLVSVALLSTSNRKRIAHHAELSISVLKAYWNGGVATAIMNELILFAISHPVIRTISLTVREGNESAIHLYQKFNFEVVGRHKDYVYVNNEYHDVLIMERFVEDGEV